MKPLIIPLPPLHPPPKRLTNLIQPRQRAPIQARPYIIISLGGVADPVSPALDDIDFAAEGPRAVRVVDGEHPQGGPDPVARGHLGADLDAAVADGGGVDGGEPCGLDGRDDGAGGLVGDGAACGDVGVGAAGEVECVAVDDVGGADDVGGECRDEVEDSVGDEGVVGGARCHFEFAISGEELVNSD